ncbi:MAG: c-type cytochrome [Candidatus Lustribacter sp.]|jgi:ubiquinol-cytochrome c reductase cytochrome c subunit
MQRVNAFAIASIVAATLVAGAGMLSAQTTAPPGDVARGHQLFVADGCYECHNYNGQGSGSRKPGVNPGPNLAPGPIPYAAFIKQVRTPRLSMPPYDTKLVSDQDAADIYAYLASQPPVKDAKSIPLLASVTVGTATNTPFGAVLYSANCAACHGSAGQGGIGPALRGESGRKDAGAVAAVVKSPGAGMPKLYPGLLSDGDVAAVASYVETLH